MKKIININLSGRVIPIEDTAYESLQRYIESLRRFFINEEGRDEIINDIESRIAELMNEKIRKGAHAVTDEDIDQIISSMGRVEDFETEAEEQAGTGAAAGGAYTHAEGRRFSGRLYRNTDDKILGGVCSGVANYLNIDPAIVRLLFALLVFGAGTGVLVYILLWIILPARPETIGEAPRPLGKRLFRNPDDKILGGVASGLAAYFNKESWVFRLAFAAPLILNLLIGVLNGLFFFWHRDIFPNFFIGSFTGTFIITYIILWIILPEAKTPYDKMEMRGEKVDVNSIRQNVQDTKMDFKTRIENWGQEVKSSADNLSSRAREFAGTQGKQFGAEVRSTASSGAKALGNVIRFIFKAFFLFIAGIIAFALFIVLIVLIFGGGVAFGTARQHILDFFLNGFWQHLFFWLTIGLLLLVPVIAFITWLVRRIMKIRSRRHYLAYVFGSLWILGIFSAAALGSSIGRDFLRGERLEQDVPLVVPGKKMLVTVYEPAVRYSGDLWFVEDGDGWDLSSDTLKLTDIKLRIIKSEDSAFDATILRYSRGKSAADALARAGKIQYRVDSRDSVLELGSGFAVDRSSKYRAQRVIVEIGVPVGGIIRFDESILEKLNPMHLRTREERSYSRYRRSYEFDWDYDEYFDWKPNVDYVMTASGRLIPASDTLTIDILNDKPTTTNTDSLQQLIDEKRKELEEEQRRLRELRRQNRLQQQSSTTLEGNLPVRKATGLLPYLPAIIG